MITFFISLIALIVGFMIYGRFVEKVFAPSLKPTPAITHNDGVDYIPLPTWKVFMIQLLNIAGLGPIFGAIAGALWGPVVYFWIVIGTIFSGAVHDYLSGMISLRHNGESISEIVGIYLGDTMKTVMRIFSVILLVLVGTVFMTGPALLLAKLTPDSLDVTFWLVVVLIYYFLATLLPIDKIIGKIYPLFGACLIIMAIGVSSGIILGGWQMPEMARCMKEEKNGRVVFYGAMVAEGIIALIWASAGIAFYETTGGLAAAIASAGPGGVVYDISFGTLGTVGGILAMIGVIACPITSGDTAFRSARYTLSDWFKIDQVSYTKRLALAIPLLGIGGILSQMNFDIIWRYFSWANQTLAVIPAIFMTMVTFTYILQAPEGFGLPTSITYPAGVIITIFWAIVYFKSTIFKK